MSNHFKILFMGVPKQVQIAEGEFYHVYNRGIRKMTICHDAEDYARLLYLTLHSHGVHQPYNLRRRTANYLARASFGISDRGIIDITNSRKADLVAFALMPNHLHLILYEKRQGGISLYMQRVLNAYTKYYNERYGTSGHLFEGKFKRVHIESNKQLLHVSAYVHRNPREIKARFRKEDKYPWSSLQDYVEHNRWGRLIDFKPILGQFKGTKEYSKFVSSSTAKEYGWESDPK